MSKNRFTTSSDAQHAGLLPRALIAAPLNHEGRDLLYIARDNSEHWRSLMWRADALRRIETDPVKIDWWTGYMRGVRRAHHGERFGTEAEHQLWLSAVESDDPSRLARRNGYVAGLTLTAQEPT